MATFEMTYKRENGEIEKVQTDKFPVMTDNLFGQIKAANLAGGRGELLNCEDVTVKPVAKKRQQKGATTMCPKCGTYCFGECDGAY